MARTNRILRNISVLALSSGLPSLAFAQNPLQGSGGVRPSVSRPVVQAAPARDGMVLDEALGRLARNPRDIAALIDAGNAALAMGDVDAATGFFRRADQVSPGNPRVQAGLAGAMVHNGDPFGAIPLFDEAEKAGASDGALAGERGLAYDLVGDNATAQRYYKQSLARTPSNEVVRRLALSYAMAGDKHNAELILSPLLGQRDLASWRTRAFALAILGQTEEAVTIANTILPSELATGVAPYLRYMPRLTKAQQAAAANFGNFPRASEIGRDDPRVAQFALRRTSVAAADAALVPQGRPLGRKSRREREREQREAGRAAQIARAEPPNPRPGRQAAVGAPAQALMPAPTAVASPSPIPMQAQANAASPPPAAETPAPRPAVSSLAMAGIPRPTVALGPSQAASPARSPSTAMAAAPGFALAPAPQPTPAAAAPVYSPSLSPAPSPSIAQTAPPPPPPVAAPARAPLPQSLAAAFAEFERPSTDASPASGAVDLRNLRLTRPEAKKPVEPPKPSHPTRIWVQLATGRDKSALAGDWRRMTRDAADAFRGRAGYVSAWGQSNRLLTGPFPSEAAATAFIAQVRRADVAGAFVWTSPAGQVVDALAGAAASNAEPRPKATAVSRQASRARPEPRGAEKQQSRPAEQERRTTANRRSSRAAEESREAAAKKPSPKKSRR